MKFFLRLLTWTSAIVLVITLFGAIYLQLSMQRALDDTGAYRAAAASLPMVDGTDGLAQQAIGAYRFRLRLARFEANPDGPVVLMLHGFPVTSAMWLPLFDPLVEAGFRVVAPDQRGYSPGARPPDVIDYQIALLTSDVIAIADALGLDRFHLVGHDWGAIVGWQVARNYPDRLLSWSALSIPHPLALADAIETDPDQRRRSRYIAVLRFPWLPEVLMARDEFSTLRAFSAGFPVASGQEYLAMFAEPGATTAALNWYRAMPESFSEWPGSRTIAVPTLFIWGSGDGVVGEKAVELQRKYLTGPYREQQVNAGHRLVSEQCTPVLWALLKQLGVRDTARVKAC